MAVVPRVLVCGSPDSKTSAGNTILCICMSMFPLGEPEPDLEDQDVLSFYNSA